MATIPQISVFESFVNSERCKTYNSQIEAYRGLRALLIQKDVKLDGSQKNYTHCLRALLIQKDVKLFSPIKL